MQLFPIRDMYTTDQIFEAYALLRMAQSEIYSACKWRMGGWVFISQGRITILIESRRDDSSVDRDAAKLIYAAADKITGQMPAHASLEII